MKITQSKLEEIDSLINKYQEINKEINYINNFAKLCSLYSRFVKKQVINKDENKDYTLELKEEGKNILKKTPELIISLFKTKKELKKYGIKSHDDIIFWLSIRDSIEVVNQESN